MVKRDRHMAKWDHLRSAYEMPLYPPPIVFPVLVEQYEEKNCPLPIVLPSSSLVFMGVIRPRGVTVSTLDSESSDRGSNPREAFFSVREKCRLGIGPPSSVYVQH